MTRHRKTIRRPRRHVPAFAPVPLRHRAGGWTPAKQAAFLGVLAETRCVRTAARRVGMTRETAYRLRRKPGAASFAAAWQVALGRLPARHKVTPAELRQRAFFGLMKPLLYRGRYVSTIRKPDNSALLRHLAQIDRGGHGLDLSDPALWSFAPRFGSTWENEAAFLPKTRSGRI
ncbi:MAG: hypothetical protein JF595_09485 [Sphingomonadales bacterium]|nr:hypothetical protein [Sphingomonadales bacterium]